MRSSRFFITAVQGMAYAALAVILLFPAFISTSINTHVLEKSVCLEGGSFSFFTWLSLLFTAGDAGALNAVSANFLRGCAFFSLLCLGVIPGAWPAHLKRLYIGLAVFLLLGLLSALLGAVPYDSVIAWSNGAAVVCVFTAVSVLSYRNNCAFSMRKVYYIFAFSALITMFWAWAMFLNSQEAEPSMYGAFYNQNLLSGWLLLILPTAFLLFAYPQTDWFSRWQVWGGIILGSALAATLFFAYNRAAWAVGAFTVLLALHGAASRMTWRQILLGTAVSCLSVAAFIAAAVWTWQGSYGQAAVSGLLSLVLLVWIIRKSCVGSWARIRWRWIAYLALTALLLGVLGGHISWGMPRAQARLQQFAQGEDSSALSRWEFYKAAWRMSLDNPLLGVGPRGFSRFYPLYQEDSRWFSRYSHCFVLDLLSEYGWLNSLVLLGCLVYIFWSAAEMLKRDTGERYVWRLGLMLGLLGLFLHAQADVDIHFAALPLSAAVIAGVLLGTPVDKWIIAEDEAPRSEFSIRPSLMRQYALSVILTVLLVLNARCAVGDYYGTLARYCQEHSQTEAAVEYFRSAVAENPFSSDYRCRLVQSMLAESAEYDDGFKMELDENSLAAVLCDPHRALCHDIRGQALEALGRWPEALEQYQQALSLDSRNLPSAFFNISRVYAHEGNTEAVKACLNMSLQRVAASVLLTGLDSPFKRTPEAFEVYECFVGLIPVREGWRWEAIKALGELGLDKVFIDYLRGASYLDLAKAEAACGHKEQAQVWRNEAQRTLQDVVKQNGEYRKVRALLEECGKLR